MKVKVEGEIEINDEHLGKHYTDVPNLTDQISETLLDIFEDVITDIKLELTEI